MKQVLIDPIEEILKFDQPEQFPLDEVLSDKDRIARGWMSVQVKDKQGEVIPVPELKKTLNTWIKRGGFVTDQHSNRVVGKALNWKEAEHPKTKEPGIIIDYQIFSDYSIDDQVWGEIKTGKRKGLSFGGRALGKPEVKTDKYSGEPARVLSNIEAYEVASVMDPANQFSENIAVNFLAKGDVPDNLKNRFAIELFAMEWKDLDDSQKADVEKLWTMRKEAEKLAQDLQKGYDVIDITKPFAGFNDFDACVSAQNSKGHSDDSAKRICGWLKHRYEGKSTDNTFASIKEGVKMENKEEVSKPNDQRPPKAWFDRCVSRVGSQSGVDNPQALCGWVYYHHMDTKAEKLKELNSILKEIEKAECDDRLTSQARQRLRTWRESNKDIEKTPEEWSDEELDGKIGQALGMLNEAKDLKTGLDNKIYRGIEMTDENKTEMPKVENPIKQEGDRISVIEAKLDQLLNLLSEKFASAKQEDEEEKPEEKKPEVPVPAEKQSPEGGKVVLPKAPVGETDATAKPETDQVRIAEKEMDDKITKKVDEILKSKGITKTSTPRTATEIAKTQEEKQPDFTMELMKEVREGKISNAEANMKIKQFINKQYREGLAKVLGKEVA